MTEPHAVKDALSRQIIELPSWAFGNSGTRFKVFAQQGVPRNPYEKLADAAQVNTFTGVTPKVSLHIPWDRVDDYTDLAKHASGDGRVAVLEILLQSYAVSHLIRESKVFQIDGYLDTASNDGSGTQSLDNCLFRYMREGLITQEEALKLANQPETLRRLASALPEE